MQRRSSRLEWIRRAKAELEAEAAAAKAAQRQREADAAEQEATSGEASGDGQASKRAARRGRGARKRADDANKLAIEKAEAAGHEPPAITTDEVSDPLAMPSRQLPTDAAGNPKPQAQRNHRFAEDCVYTDPDSHIFKGSEGWVQGYNAQAAVDGDHQVIVAIGVSNQASDAVHLVPMLKRIQANTGQLPAVLTADAGYCSTNNLEACEQRGLDAYISTSRQQHGKRPRPSRGRAAIGQAEPLLDEQRAKRQPHRLCRGASGGTELRRIGCFKLFPRHQGRENHPAVVRVQRAIKRHMELLD